MEQAICESRIEILFPDPDPVVHRKVGIWEAAKAKLEPRLNSQLFILRLLTILIATGLLIEFSIGFIFNDRLISGNVAEELSFADQVLRGTGAFAMVFGIMFVVLGLHVAFKPKVEVSYRVVAGLVAIGIGTGMFLVASAIGHSVFGSLFDKLWGGSGSSVALDPSQVSQVNTLNAAMPFGLRLVGSSALFLGVAFFVALCEVAWLHIYDRIAHARELLAEVNLGLSKFAEGNAAKEQGIQSEQEFNQTQDTSFAQNFILGKVMETVQGWRSAIEGFRPKATNIAKLSQEDYQSQKRATAKIEAAISASEASPQDTHELKELIERLMVNTVSKSTNQPATPSA